MFYYYVIIALYTGHSTTYGYGEMNCGDIGTPRSCSLGAITASGEPFDPTLPTAAVAAPTNLRGLAVDVWLQIGDGPCIKIRVNDKMNPRYIGKRAFDLSPEALKQLLGKSSPHWSGVVQTCKGNAYETTSNDSSPNNDSPSTSD